MESNWDRECEFCLLEEKRGEDGQSFKEMQMVAVLHLKRRAPGKGLMRARICVRRIPNAKFRSLVYGIGMWNGFRKNPWKLGCNYCCCC